MTKRGELKIIISDPAWAEEAADAIEIEALRRLAWEGWERAVEAEDWQRAMRTWLRRAEVTSDD